MSKYTSGSWGIKYPLAASFEKRDEHFIDYLINLLFNTTTAMPISLSEIKARSAAFFNLFNRSSPRRLIRPQNHVAFTAKYAPAVKQVDADLNHL